VIALACLVLLAGPFARADALPATAREAAVAALFDKALQSPPALRLFLRQMPKGGDLHNHLGGNVYAEDFLRWAAADGLCADGTRLVPPPCAAGHAIKDIFEHQPGSYGALVDAFSTRGWQAGVGRNDISGHDQFFATFGRFGPAEHGHTADALVLTRRVAAGDRLSYLELDYDPAALEAYVIATPDVPLDEAGLAARYAQELPGIAPVVASSIAELASDEAKVAQQLDCAGTHPEPGCAIGVHYLAYALRALPPAAVFRQLILGFALTQQDPRFVGVNIVQPEDWPVPLRDYNLHMAMFRFLEGKYPGVHRSLHAGELALGQVPPQDLRDHIAQAIAVGGAQRIGHGTDIAYEDEAASTMKRMARDGIAVEINLSSNAVILGVSGADHPLQLYRSFGVPFVLSSDDQGVLRSDMTNEYVRAAREQGLRYADLKAAARASLEYSFMPGSSLWASHQLGSATGPCARSLADAACQRFAQANEKAMAQLALEQQFDTFENGKTAEHL
jgi:adenosine deaminase